MLYYRISYKNRPIGESGESCKSKYDLTQACKECGTGATLIGHLRVKGLSKVNKYFLETVDGDYLISKNLYIQIKSSFPQFKLLQVIDSRNNFLDYYHLTGNVTLPKFKKDSSGYIIDRQCQTCKRNGYFTDAEIGDYKKNMPTVVHPYILRYDIADFENIKNEYILNTWECFGLSNKTKNGIHVIRYARPITIVNEDVKNIFDNVKVKGIEYEQIIFEQH